MTIPQPRQLKIGAIIDKTLGVVEYSIAAVAVYVASLTVINGVVKYFTLGVTSPMKILGITLVTVVVGISAGYLLLEAMLRKTGLRSRADDDVFLPYLALWAVSTLGVMAGVILLVLPGLVIMARWSIAAPMLLARGEGAMKALGESWERTSGNEFQILVAALALLIVPIAALIACSLLFDPANPVGIGVSQLVSSAMSALLVAMGVALYGLIDGGKGAASLTK